MFSEKLSNTRNLSRYRMEEKLAVPVVQKLVPPNPKNKKRSVLPRHSPEIRGLEQFGTFQRDKFMRYRITTCKENRKSDWKKYVEYTGSYQKKHPQPKTPPPAITIKVGHAGLTFGNTRWRCRTEGKDVQRQRVGTNARFTLHNGVR